MAVKITDIEIACDDCLDENLFSDVNQEVGFLGEEKMDFLDTQSKTGDPLLVLYQQEMLMDQGAREAAGVCECCNGTGSYWDCGPHNSRREPCDNCNGTGFIKDQDA